MHPYVHTETQSASVAEREETLMEQEILAQWGFTPEQIVSLLWLRQRYSAGRSDRVPIVHQLEFLRFLVRCGELEL
jgi:hypothetical protein